VEFSTPTITVAENAGAAQLTVGVFFGPGISAPRGATVTVGLRVAGGTAVSGVDFTPPPASVTVNIAPTAGNPSFVNLVGEATVSVPIINNTRQDGDRTIVLALESPPSITGAVSPTGAPASITLGNISTTTVTIQDDDTSPVISGAAQAAAAARQAATLGSLAVITSTVQTANIGLRLQALRQGATGASLGGLDLKRLAANFAGPSESPGAMAESSAPALLGGSPSMLPSRLGVFANVNGSFGNQDVTSREPGFDFHTIGLTLGADYRFTDQFVFGLAFAYLRTKLDLDSAAGNSSENSYSLSAYANYYILEKLYVDAITTFGGNTYHTERNNTDGNGTAEGSTDGPQLSVSVGSGYNFNVGPLTVGPSVRVDYVRVHIDGYNETGAGPSNARIGSQTIESVTTNVGGQAMYAISLGWGVLSPFLRTEWVHEFKGDSRGVTATVGPTSVIVQTNNPDRDYLNLAAGASATFRGGVSAFLDYNVVLGRTNFTSNAFTCGVRIEF